MALPFGTRLKKKKEKKKIVSKREKRGRESRRRGCVNSFGPGGAGSGLCQHCPLLTLVFCLVSRKHGSEDSLQGPDPALAGEEDVLV